MTILFDNIARQNLVNEFDETDYTYNGTPIKNMVVRQVSCAFARKYIASFHYSKTMPDSSLYIYAGYLDNRLCGIVVYGMGCGKNQYTSLIPNIENGSYIELTRLWCVDAMPKNTESKLISESLKLLPPQIKLVLSFADESEGHCGIIYQATNWYYLGINKGGKMLLCENGIKKHPRLLGIYRKRHKEYENLTNDELMKILNYSYVDGGKKHRYVYLRGTKKEKKQMFKFIEGKIKPYPKSDKKRGLSELQIINGFNSKNERLDYAQNKK